MKNVSAGFAAIVILFLLVGAFVVGESRSEIVECNTWQAQSLEFKGFYLTHWQAEQCEAHHIIITAPVH